MDLSGGNRGRGDAAGDSFDGIERYVGSYHADIFIAGDDEEHITGGPTTGGPGDAGDTSSDTVSYVRSDEGVTVDLSTGTAQSTTDNGYASGDTLASIENVIGSNHGDTLTAGGAGSDTFVFASGDGDDEINTFTITDGADKIDLSAFTSIASLDDLRDEISDRGGDIEIDLPGNGEIRLNSPTGFEADEEFYGLTADNFIFYTKPTSGTRGDRFNNEINGGRGDETIYGENGRDILNGGEGNDWLDGGPGADTFVFEPGNGNDYIMDWESGEKIDLSAFVDEDGTDLITDTPTRTEVDGNYVIDLTESGGGTITVLGVTTVPDDDFIL